MVHIATIQTVTSNWLSRSISPIKKLFCKRLVAYFRLINSVNTPHGYLLITLFFRSQYFFLRVIARQCVVIPSPTPP